MNRFRLQRGLMLTAWMLGVLFVGLNLLLGILYQDRIYPGIRVGSVDVGNLTRQQATLELQRQASAFHIALSVDGHRYDVKPKVVGASYDISTSVAGAFNIGHGAPLPLVGMLSALRPQPVSFAYVVDRVQLKNFVATLATSQAQAPVDATVVVTNGVPKVQPDKSGLGINKAMLENAILGGLGAGTDQVAIVRSEISADVRAPQAETAAEQAAKLVQVHIVLSYQDKQFVPSPAQVGSWLVFTKKDDGTLSVGTDQTKIQAYFTTFAAQVEVAATPKKVTAVNGVVKDVQDGKTGLAIDRAALAKQVSDALTIQKTATLGVTTVVVAFKTIYNNSISLDAAQYIEVNLTTQHLWAYQDHQIAYESPVTSGATGAGYPTVQGLFSIYSKERNRYLDGRPLGYNYNVFVQYWMPFYADYGLHDASWRSTYGGQDYYYNGSHGCVNLPLATAEWLFNWAAIGTPVWVHG